MRPKIFLFGDSITEESFGIGGWGASLVNHFARMVDVVLRGYSGYNTRWALKVLDKVFPAKQDGDNSESEPIAVTVFFGANDASLPDRCSAFQHVPLHEYKHNLHSIVSFFKKRWPNTHVLLITPPPIDEDARLRFPYVENKEGLPERTNDAAGEYARACIAIAGECGVPVIDIWSKMQHCPEWKKEYLRGIYYTKTSGTHSRVSYFSFRGLVCPTSDGLHLTQSGNQVVFEEVIRKLRDEGVSVEALPVDLPLISDIDPDDPMKVFQ